MKLNLFKNILSLINCEINLDLNWTENYQLKIMPNCLSNQNPVLKEQTFGMKINRQTKSMTVCSCHVMNVFQSETALYSCLNVKEPLTQSRCKIWSLSDCNWTRTRNYLVHYELCACRFESSCRPNQYLEYLFNLSFQELNRLFVLLFEDEKQRKSYKRYYIPTFEIKIYNAMTNG